MSLPKEPRQKMINMMYLVLTAMLALNVSSEILNAFKTVNRSITNSNISISDKNALTYKSLDAKLKDAQTKARAEVWAPKAYQARQLSNDLFSYLGQLQTRLKQEAGLKKNSKGEEDFKEDNLDAATRLMDKQGEGKKLYEQLKQYREKMIGILNPAEFSNDPVLQSDVKKKKEEFEKSLPVDLSIPESKSGNKRTGNVVTDWMNNYFHMTPTIAGLTILSKFQNDVKNSESQVVDYCHTKIGEVIVVYDKFQVIAQANTTYAMPGDDIEIIAGIGAFSAAAKPKITIGGQPMTLTPEGTALWKTTASGAGKKVVDVLIEYTKPDGTTERVPKKVTYEVAMPAGVAVSANKMNVLYIGVPNPLTITAGVGSEKISANFGGGEIHRIGGNQWEANPKTPGEHNINIIIEGKSTPVKFRVKYLPDPAAFVGPKRGGSMQAADFKVQLGVIARLIESDFEAPFKVISYTVGAIGGAYPIYQIANNEGNRWNGRAADIINKATPGTTVFFDQIKVVGPDGRSRDLPQMSFNLK